MRAKQSVEDGIPTRERGNEVVRLWVMHRALSQAVIFRSLRDEELKRNPPLARITMGLWLSVANRGSLSSRSRTSLSKCSFPRPLPGESVGPCIRLALEFSACFSTHSMGLPYRPPGKNAVRTQRDVQRYQLATDASTNLARAISISEISF
jgi:hypothetical protein